MTDLLKIYDSDIIRTARSYIGTPFHHHGRLKNIGVDCLGLLIGVAKELNLNDKMGRPIQFHDTLNYGVMPNEKNCLKRNC